MYRLVFALGMPLTSVSAAVQAQGERYPSRPVRVIVPYTAGGANDIFARLVLTRAVSDLGRRGLCTLR